MPRIPTPHPPQAGFTLVHLSIVLAVAAIIMAAALPGKNSADANLKTISTLKKMEKIEDATKGFMVAYGRRPCPADGQFAVGSANFGREAGTNCNSANALIVPLGPDAGTGNVVAGTVPTKTLGLPDSYGFDEWGRRITYVVDKRAAISAATNSCSALTAQIAAGTATSGISIKDSTGGNLIDTSMYAYISHGQSGHGAWPPAGSTVANRINSGSTDADMLTNAGVDSSFTYNTTNFTSTKVQKNRTTTFDDITWYRKDTKDTCCAGTLCTITVPGFRIDGIGDFWGDNENTGASIAVGDVNGDGIPDLVIGAPNWNNGYGRIYVVFGTLSGFPNPLPLSSLNGTNGIIYDSAWQGNLGALVAVGDVNGDGIADIISGEGFYGYGGMVIAVFGKTSGWSNTTINSAYLNGVNGEEFDDDQSTFGAGSDMNFYGVNSLTTSDVNGDGVADIILGLGGAGRYTYYDRMGRVDVIFGKKTGWSSTPVTMSASFYNGTNGVEFYGANGWDYLGASVAAGDVNGDGIKDLIIGAPIFNNHAGTAYVVFGKTSGWPSSPTTMNSTFINGTNGLEFDGANVADYTGRSVASGDVNGDGIADILIGMPGHPAGLPASGDNNNPRGFAVVFGKTSGWTTPNTLNATYLNGTRGVEFDDAVSSNITGAVLATGDINKDGVDDIFTSGYYANTNTGKVFAIFGKTSGWSGTATLLNSTFINGTNGVEFDGVNANDNAGVSIATGDFNGDHINDLLIGRQGSYSGNVGKVYGIYGKRSGWSATFNLGGL